MANNKRRGGFGFGINLTGPGTVFTLGIIALVIGMGLVLTRGVTPESQLSDPGQTGDIEIIEETPAPDEKGLQLRTIRFRECASTVTIDLLLDRSGSMGEITPSGQTKLTRLKEAVMELIGNAQDESIIGIQSFSTPVVGAASSLTNDVPVSYYRDVKTLIPAALNSYRANGATPTHDALAYSYGILRDAIPNFPPEREFNFIFVSDGAPCPGIGCPGTTGSNQDPRLYTPNPAQQIKDLGVTVYSLGIFNGSQSLDPALAEVLKNVASSPDHYYAANTGDDIKLLLAQISNRICQQAASPTPSQ